MNDRDVVRIFDREIANYFQNKLCPKCGMYSNMVKLNAWKDEESFDGFKCLYCGALLIEKLEEVDSTPNVTVLVGANLGANPSQSI
ncbi:MAG TPA: hypothetical protein VMW45_00665 [Dehalococcoidia bacterium]|nr:hypothetical protein [Dehalococcoidia bacterium]